MFDPHLERWDLQPDGDPVRTHSSDLLPVRSAFGPAVLKVPRAAEERVGARLMVWWAGDGAARAYRFDAGSGAVLLERLDGPRSLAAMALDGRDDEACRVLCAVAARLHAPRAEPPPQLVPLERWFRALPVMAGRHGGFLRDADAVARDLLAAPRDVTVLHGDLHHGNVLDGGERGWLAIDPKGLRGERGFDFANTFCNPDLGEAARPERLARRASVIAGAARVERARLLRWVVAYAGLSAAWWLEDGRADRAAPVLEVGRVAAAELARS